MATFLALPILGLLVIVQSALISRMQLLNGTADLVLLALVAWAVQERVRTSWHWAVVGGLMITLVSALPPGAALAGYLLATAIALAFRRWVWQVSLLAMIAGTFFGTLVTQLLAIGALRFNGTPIPWIEALNTVTLPSALLNLLLAIPVYALLTDLASWVYPEEIEI
jgi:rod shape-determining protein MreD